MKTCKNCKNKFHGNFCNECGEKVIEDKDFSFFRISTQAFGSITNFDSKIFRTLKLLLFFPGRLTSKFVEGIRVPYMKPFQVFVIANVVFFLFLSDVDLFRTPSHWFFIENFDGIKVLDKVDEIITSRGLEESEVAALYDKRSANLAKGLIFLLIPFIGLIGLLLNFRKKFEFGKHLIFATHFFAFILLICVLISEMVDLVFSNFSKWYFILPITFLMTLYYILGYKSFYQNGWIASILKGLLGIFLINILIQFYRVAINALSLNTI